MALLRADLGCLSSHEPFDLPTWGRRPPGRSPPGAISRARSGGRHQGMSSHHPRGPVLASVGLKWSAHAVDRSARHVALLEVLRGVYDGADRLANLMGLGGRDEARLRCGAVASYDVK